MLKRISALALIVLVLTSHFGIALTFAGYGAEETDALTALRLIEEELKKGKIPSGSITEACFTIPEGFPAELAQRLWFFIAQLVSMGFSEEEMRRTIKGANDTLKLPARIDYELKDYIIIPEYEKIHIRRSNDGSVSVEIPYRAVDKKGNEKDVSSIRYESNGTNVFHVLYRYPKKRTYLIRLVDPDSYTFTFINPETGEIFNKTARIKIGLFSNISQGYFVENFLVAVPGHFEDTREVVQSQVSEFRVLLPAYDPIAVDTSISSTRVGIGDTITITAQIRNPQEIRGNYMIMLGARLSDNDAFEAWAPPPGPAYLAPLYLKAKKPGVYTITIYFAVVEPSSLDIVFWNGGKTVTYTVEVLPEPPRLEIRLASQAVAKFANLTITLINKGGQRARNVKLFITGDVDEKELETGTIVGLWSKNVVTKLLSPIAKVNVTVVYYDEESKRYASTALTTISTTNFIAPEEWRSYVVKVEEYNETRRVFVPGYQGATHLKLYFMATGMVPEYLSDFDGVRLIPISPDGFTLTLENSSYFSKTAKTLNVKYALIDVKPSFLYERILREDEVKKLLSIPEDERLEPSKVPSNYEVKLLKEEVLNQSETVTVSDEFYEWLKYNGWEDHDYKYEDTGETRWNLDKATASVPHGKKIELVYRPLAYGGGSLVQGVLVKNYAACDVEYGLEASSGPMRAPPERRTINVPAFGSTPLQLVQLEDTEYPIFISLKYGDRVIATLQVSFRSGELPVFWRGFWNGFASKGLGIVATCGIMIVVGFVLPPKWAAAASLIVLVTGIAMNIAEVWTDVHNALVTMDSLNGLADVCEGRAKEFNEIGMTQHANELSELAQTFRLEARDIDDNLLSNVFSNLALDVSWDEIRLAFGLREQPSTRDKDYRVGYATGRIVGAIASCAAYVTTFYAVVNRIRAERIGGKPLSVKDALRIVGRGIYNWITPAIWDAVMLKLKPSFHKATDLLLGNKYSRKLGDIIGDLVERINNPLVVENTLETVSRLSKHVLENVPSRESSGRILDAISMIIEHYSPEELEEKGGAIARSIVSIWIKDGDEGINLLSSWIDTNAEEPARMEVLEKALLATGGDATKEVLLKIGDIVDGYLGIKSVYGTENAEAFLDKVLKNPSILPSPEYEGIVTISSETINLKQRIDKGTYLVVARIKDGIIKMWSVNSEGASQIRVHYDLFNELKGKEVTITVYPYSYELYFPKKFEVGAEMGLRFSNGKPDKIIIGGLGIEVTDSEEGYYQNYGPSLKVATELKSMCGAKLELVFYENGRVGIVAGGEPQPIKKASITESASGLVKILEIEYEGKKMRIALNPQSLEFNKEYKVEIRVNGQSGKGLVEILKEEFGYDGVEKIKESIGSKYVIIVEFDNGETTCCGSEKLRVRVPEGASTIKWIKVVTLEDYVSQLLVQIIEADDLGEVHDQIGEAGERIVIEGEYKAMDYHKDILEALSTKMGIPVDELKGKVSFDYLGKKGVKEVDGKIIVKDDIVVNAMMVFKKGDVIAILEMESTVAGWDSLEDLCKGAVKDLKKHMELDKYKDTQYGIAMGFSYDPVDTLAGKRGELRIEVYTREELEGLGNERVG